MADQFQLVMGLACDQKADSRLSAQKRPVLSLNTKSDSRRRSAKFTCDDWSQNVSRIRVVRIRLLTLGNFGQNSRQEAI
jgi:hypothetical protein